MHKFVVCTCKSQDFAQSQKTFERSHDRMTVYCLLIKWDYNGLQENILCSDPTIYYIPQIVHQQGHSTFKKNLYSQAPFCQTVFLTKLGNLMANNIIWHGWLVKICKFILIYVIKEEPGNIKVITLDIIVFWNCWKTVVQNDNKPF